MVVATVRYQGPGALQASQLQLDLVGSAVAVSEPDMEVRPVEDLEADSEEAIGAATEVEEAELAIKVEVALVEEVGMVVLPTAMVTALRLPLTLHPVQAVTKADLVVLLSMGA